jgi:chloramphenicol 3-O-phosphotransferase
VPVVVLFGGPAGAGKSTLARLWCSTRERAAHIELYDVAVDDVFEPERFERDWRPRLAGLDLRLVVLLPSLGETLARAASRGHKRVREHHIRAQYDRCRAWPPERRIDTTGLTPEESLGLVIGRLAATS